MMYIYKERAAIWLLVYSIGLTVPLWKGFLKSIKWQKEISFETIGKTIKTEYLWKIINKMYRILT